MKKVYSILALSLFLSCVVVSASYAKDKKEKINTGDVITTVAELNNTQDDSYITLKGYITKKLKHEKYLFQDSTGEVVLDIDKKINKQLKGVDEKTLVEVYGEFDKKDSYDEKHELDVKKVTILN